MKKFLAILVMLTLTVCSCFALADGLDFSGMSDDELLALMKQVQQEIVDRRIEGTATLPGGKYIGGKDIPAGTYIYTCLAKGSEWGNVTIYSEKGDGKQLFWQVVVAPDDGEEPQSFFITINDDDELDSQVPFSLTIYTGTFQFALVSFLTAGAIRTT